MKRFTFIVAAVFAVFGMFSCTEKLPNPVFSSTTEGDIRAAAEGGEYSLTYSIENPAENGEVAATADVDWIDSWNYDTDGKVSFNVRANETEEDRPAVITVTYSYSGGSPQSFTVNVLQAAKGTEPPVPGAPELTLTSEGEISAEAAGSDFEITYTLDNPVEGVNLKAEHEDWITTTINDGNIAVKVDPNTDTAERTGTITVTYPYQEENNPSFTVTVNQKGAQGGGGETPFTIEVPADEVGATSARVIATCSDASLYWTSQIMTQSEFDTYVGDIANMETYLMQLLQNTADYYGYGSIQEMLPDFLYPGTYTDDYVYSGLDSQTKHLTYSVGMDMDATLTTDFYFGPEFTTLEPQLSDLTIEIVPTPQTTSVLLDLYPSDQEEYYFATVIDDSFYTAGYTDEDIMNNILSQYGWLLAYYALQGDMVDYQISGMLPQTEYYAVAFGVDVNSATYTTELFKVAFTTLESQPTDAYVTASMDNYWDINDLAEYNPDYGGLLQDPTNPVLAAVDFEYNETATQCTYILWIGDQTASPEDEIYSATLAQGDVAYAGDPAPLFYVAFDGDPTTLCVIGMDANGNFGDMYMEVITFSESGKSTDYALFDDYYNAIMAYSVKSSAPAIMKPQTFIAKEMPTVMTAKAEKKISKVVSMK